MMHTHVAKPLSLDVIIVGAGLSGIGAAVHLKRKASTQSVAILEARDRLGGTWDLFRYPGIRSDSDMHTLGYNFKPWTLPHSIGSGAEILSYIEETATEFGVKEQIRFNHKVLSAEWDSGLNLWRLTVMVGDTATIEMTCRFLYLCSGYYSYEQGFTPSFPGLERFRGTVVHPQAWPENLEYDDKKIVVIGSGATAVTLLPAMAERAKHVTMLQRTPGYVISRPKVDRVGQLLRAILPRSLGYSLMRWKHRTEQRWLFRAARRHPDRVRKQLIRGVAKALGNAYYAQTHFAPDYNPWDQRLCLVPDADLFRAIRAGKASVVTDQIEFFEEDGIRIKSGRMLAADIVVTATGLNLSFAGGLPMRVDGEPVHIPSRVTYRSCMLEGVPNLAFAFGYTNSSFTLRTDLVADFVAGLLNHMESKAYESVRPVPPADMKRTIWFDDFQPGYIKRALGTLPQQGDAPLWRNSQDYETDRHLFASVPPSDPSLHFS